MPVTIRQATVSFKDQNGDYIGLNTLAQQTTQEMISDIEDARDAALDSIPADYTALSTTVGNHTASISSQNTSVGELENQIDSIQIATLEESKSYLNIT